MFTSPTQVSPTPSAQRVEFELIPPQPFRLGLTALALVRRPQNRIDTWEGGVYRRWIPAHDPGTAVAPPQFLLEVRSKGEAGGWSERLHVTAIGRMEEAQLAGLARSAVVHMFGLDVDLSDFYRSAAGDARLGPLVRELEGLRPPRYPGLFQALLNAVPCQQVTLVLGLQLLERLARRFGPMEALAHEANAAEGPTPLPSAPALAAASPEELSALGLSRAKARTLVELAQECVRGELDLRALAGASNEAVSARLQELYGVGRWTSDYVLLRGLGRLDVFPYGDSGARNGLARFVGQAGKPDYDWVAATVEPWQPHAGFVYLHLLVKGMLRSGQFDPL